MPAPPMGGGPHVAHPLGIAGGRKKLFSGGVRKLIILHRDRAFGSIAGAANGHKKTRRNAPGRATVWWDHTWVFR